jgi:hypothetical protein
MQVKDNLNLTKIHTSNNLSTTVIEITIIIISMNKKNHNLLDMSHHKSNNTKTITIIGRRTSSNINRRFINAKIVKIVLQNQTLGST